MVHATYNDYYEPLEKFVSGVIEKFQVSHCDLTIANQNVRLISPYEPLINKLKPAIEHLSSGFSNEAIDFKIFLIDLSRTEGFSLPSIPWEPLFRRGHRGILVDGMYLQFVHIKETDVKILSAYDSRNDCAYYIVSSTEGLPWYISGAPMHEILYWWVRTKNMHILHCGVVGNDTSGLAFLGSKGAGKSTMVLTCLENGFQYVSEDYCVVTNDEEPIAYNLYNSAKFTNFTFEKFPHLTKFRKNEKTVNEKYLVYYKDIYPDKMVNSFPIKALISLNLEVDATSSLKKIDVDQTFLDMIASTTLQNPIYELASTDFFQKLKLKTPGYELTYGRDTEATLELLTNLLN